MTDFETIWSELRDPKTTYGALAYAVVFAFFAWLTGRALSLAVKRTLERPTRIPADPTAIRFLGQLARLGVYLFAFVSWAHLIPALQKMGSAWLASVGVVSVVLGLAAQNTLGNLVAGISLLLYRPFNLGDRIQVAAPSGLETGIVESLNLGYTVLLTADNRRVVIPNSLMASQTSIHLSLADPRKKCTVPFRFNAGADVDKARAILLELAKQNPLMLEVIGCPLTTLGGASITLSLQGWCRDPDTVELFKNELLESARKRFAMEGIELYSWRRDK